MILKFEILANIKWMENLDYDGHKLCEPINKPGINQSTKMDVIPGETLDAQWFVFN